MSTVEFHPWNSRRADTEKPDEWRIDLDPGAGVRLRRPCAGSPTSPTRCSTSSARPAGRRPRGGNGHARLRADRARARLRRRTPGRARLRPRGRAARTRRRDHHLVAQGPRPARSCSSTTTRTPATTRSPRPTRCAATPRARSRPRSAGTRSTTSSPATSRSPRCRRGSPSSATCTPASTTHVFDIAPLLEWADRDEAAGAEPPADPDDA